ncbi:Ankyrin repeat-containing domain protein, partial [Rhypophila decipiens]
GIPVEIMQDIASYLDNKTDLLALTRTNRWLYSVVTPMLYAHDIKFNHSSSIFWAADHGLLGTLIRARAAGANLDTQCSAYDGQIYPQTEGGTPLHYAARAGHDHLVQWLIEQGVDINAPSRRTCNCGQYLYHPRSSYRLDIGWIPLHTALCHNKLSAAMVLLNHNSSLDLLAPGSDHDDMDSKSHRYALHLASARGILSIIDHLYSNFDIDIICGILGETALRLLSLGADIDSINDVGETPLATAVHEGNFLAAMRLLNLGASADPRPHEPDAAAVRPLFLCARYHPDRATGVYRWPDEKQNGGWDKKRHLRHRSNTEALIRALVDAGADVNARFDVGYLHGPVGPTTGMPALAVACCTENWTAVSALVKCGASVHIQDGDGNTPLYLSLLSLRNRYWCEKRQKVVLFLLRKGACMDSNSLKIVFDDDQPRGLCKQVLEVSTKDTISHDEFEMVIMSPARRNDIQHPRITKLLLDFAKRTYGISRRSIQRYLKNIFEVDDYKSFQVLRDEGYVRLVPHQAEVNKPEYLANPSAVCYSLESLLVKSLRLEANKLSDILVRSVGLSTIGLRFSGGATLLHIAVTEQRVSVVEELLDRGADGNDFDGDFDTPLTLAMRAESMELVRILLKDGANPHARPSKSQLQERRKEESFESAFEEAVGWYHKTDIIQEMLKFTHLPDIPLGAESSYVHLAIQPATTNVLSFLLERGADPNGGEGCVNPPAAMILKNLWENQEEDDYELELAFQKLGLLLA